VSGWAPGHGCYCQTAQQPSVSVGHDQETSHDPTPHRSQSMTFTPNDLLTYCFALCWDLILTRYLWSTAMGYNVFTVFS